MTQEEACFSDNGTWTTTSAGRRFVYKNGAYPTNSWRYIEDECEVPWGGTVLLDRGRRHLGFQKGYGGA